MSRVPRIRFKGFEEDWEQRKFVELFLEKRDKTQSEDEDVLLSCAITGIYLNSELFSHFRGTSNIGYLKIKKNDLILSAQNLHLGNANVNLLFEHGIISPAYKVYELNKCDQYFVQSWVKKDSTKDFFLNATTEGASQCRKNIDWCILNNQLIVIPSLHEQFRIGKLFNSLNHLITLHQRKLEKLKIIKKSMLENLFPQNGEKTPKIRFSGFTEDWEQRKLGDICNIITKQTGFDYSSTIKPALLKEKADNTYPFIQNKDFNGTTINMDTDFFIPISVAEKFPNIVLDRPSLLISISGRIGNVGFYSCVHKAFIGGAVGICKLKYNDDGKFIIHELESEYGQKYFHLLIKASSHANITVEDIRNMELIFPNKKEEKVCISTFFSTLDNLITLHQSKLEKLKKIKKSMLESMFV